MKNLEERKKAIKVVIYEYCPGEQIDLLNDFIDYWTEHNEPVRANTKMRFELEKVFNIGRRWGTWKKNAKRFAPKTSENGFKVNPDNWYWKGFDGQRFQIFKAFMRENGYEWNTQFSKFNQVKKWDTT